MTKDICVSAVRRNNHRLYLIALSFVGNHYDAEDIIQNVFIKLWKQTAEFENDEHIDKWLTRVCINESKNYLKLPFRKHRDIDELTDLYSFDKTRDIDIFNAVMSLPQKERTVIHLFYYEDLPVKDMADLLGIRESAVKTRLHRARNKLREILGEDWINE